MVFKENGLPDRMFMDNGVREYWLVGPGNKTVQIYQLGEEGRYGRPEVYAAGDQVKAGIFSDLTVDLAAVFSE